MLGEGVDVEVGVEVEVQVEVGVEVVVCLRMDLLNGKGRC